MKKILALILVVCTLIFVGCQEHQSDVTLACTTNKIDSFVNLEENDVELLRVEKGKSYINELDTFTNPFLFTTKAIHVLNADGSLDTTVTVTTNKRIVDFIEINGVFHFFNLICRNDEYFIELCKFDANFNEEKITEYKIDDPFAYPRFVKFGKEYYFKINKNIYRLSDLDILIESDKDIFLSKPAVNEKFAAYKTSKTGGYSFFAFDDSMRLNFEGNYGFFALSDEGLIYTDLETKHLMLCCDGVSETLYADNEVYDFAVFDENRVIIVTHDEILLCDLSSKKIVAHAERPASTVRWIFSDMNGNACLYSNDAVHQFTITTE